MAERNKTRPSKRKRLALREASSPQASAPGAAETGKAPSSPVPGQATRFFDRFSRRDALAALVLGLSGRGRLSSGNALGRLDLG